MHWLYDAMFTPQIRLNMLWALPLLAFVGFGSSMWPFNPETHFDQPQMSVHARTGVDICVTGPGFAVSLPRFGRVNCTALHTRMRPVFDVAKASADADMDFHNVAYRLVGRYDQGSGQVVVPGIECASRRLRNAIEGSACLFVYPPHCMGYAEFDRYARAYNEAFLSRSVSSDPACRAE